MNKKIRNIILIILSTLVVVWLITSFAKAWNNTDKKNSSNINITAEYISSKYDSINYGSLKNIDDVILSEGGSFNLSGNYMNYGVS